MANWAISSWPLAFSYTKTDQPCSNCSLISEIYANLGWAGPGGGGGRNRRHRTRSERQKINADLRPLHLAFRGFRTQSTHHGLHGRAQDAADAQQGTQRNRFAGLDPLPVTDGIAEGDHVFLAVAAALAQPLDTLAQCGKEFAVEFGVFGQQCSCTTLALNWPRCI